MNFTRNLASLGLFSAVAFAIAPNAQAASFGTNGISFDKDTTLEFTFQVSHGKFESNLSAFDGFSSSLLLEEVKRTDDGFNSEALKWTGTCDPGNLATAVQVCTKKYEFKQGSLYSLRLAPSSGGMASSTSAENAGGQQRAVFASQSVFENDIFPLPDGSNFADAASYTDGLDLLMGDGVWIGFDDGGNGGDLDYQDFVVSAKIVDDVDVPEPASVMGLVAIGAAALKLRRRNDD